jgi:Tol biopolymer transport system component
MKIRTLVLFIIAVCFILFVSCDNESDNLIQYPPIIDDTTNIAEDTTYNFAYEDSILFSSTRELFWTNVQMGSINGTGIRSLCDSLISYDGSWSPNKRKIIFVGSPIYSDHKNWGLYLLELKNYELTRLVPQETKVITASFSPDLKYIAYAVFDESLGKKVKLLNNKDGEIIEVTDWIFYDMNVLSWGPDSKRILFDNGYCINIEDHSITRLFSDGPFQIFLPNWSPDGTKVSFSSSKDSQPNLRIYDISTGEIRFLFRQDTLFQFNSSWSKDSKTIFFDQRPFGNSNGYLCKINIDGSGFVRLTDGSENDWSPRWYK